MIHRAIFTPERLAAAETTPALLKEKGVKAHAKIPDSSTRRSYSSEVNPNTVCVSQPLNEALS